MDKKQQVNLINSIIDADPSVLDDYTAFMQLLAEKAPDLYKHASHLSQPDFENYLENNGVLLVVYNDYTYPEWLKELRRIEHLTPPDIGAENMLINEYSEYYKRHLIMCENNDGYDPVED